MKKEKYIKFDEVHKIKSLNDKFDELTKVIEPIDNERENYAHEILQLIYDSKRFKNFIKKKDYESAKLLVNLIPKLSVCRLLYLNKLRLIQKSNETEH
jgi:hypothetical protein